jgi:hypothetical protein
MTRHGVTQEQRMIDLLVDRATEGLVETETQELERLLGAFPEQDAHEFDWAAAALNLATMGPAGEPLPTQLRDRLMIDAGMYFGAREQILSPATALPQSTGKPLAPHRMQRMKNTPWYFAAASLALAVLGWWQVFALNGPAQPVSLKYAQFLENPDIVRASWVASEERYAAVSGEVLWSNASQSGYMRFVRLEPNDPERFQYQLWIIDPDRDSHAVDGGVFDIPNVGEVIVPMNAKLRVDKPRTFAITLEKAGGVVVSSGPVLLVGHVPG